MHLIAHIVFWVSIAALLHTYVLYPRLVRLMARGRKGNQDCYAEASDDLPFVSVLMSVYNEETVLAEKMKSLLALQYPPGKLRIWVGSDASSDGTNALVAGFLPMASEQLHFLPYELRRGKPPVINDLAQEAMAMQPAGENHVLVLTDASVILEPDTLFHLVKHYKNKQIGVVDAFMHSAGLRQEGISQSEHRYMSGEVQLKWAEGRLWGKMIGPFGGCYALRSDLFEPVPPNSLVDDFYLVFRALEKDYSAINEPLAVCTEGATHQVRDEFRRKRRIAAGSFQNLMRFRRWVLPPTTTLGFAFFSHKVLRWFGGFFLLGAWLSAGFLAIGNQTYLYLFCMMSLGILGIPLLQKILDQLKIDILPVKNIAYFLAMNVALIAGFFKWLRGIRENTWERTPRY